MRTSQSSQVLPCSRTVDYDLAIVGGGIVGLTLAAALKDSGLRVALIEAKKRSLAVSQGRAYVISLMSGQILSQIGVWQRILTQISTFSQIHLSDADDPGVVKFHPQDLGRDGLGYAAEHRVLLEALQEELQACPHVSWLCPVEVVSTQYEADAVEIELNRGGEKSVIRTRLLVGADGSKSHIRQAAGIRTYGWPYWQSCVVATIKPELSHQNIAYERFWPTGPMGILPLPGNRCQVVWTAPHAKAKEMKEWDEERFLTELEFHTGGKLGRLSLLGDRILFPVQLMQSDRYVLPRLALIGDAAHCCHPVGGQGMNLGIRDAAALARVLQSACQQGEDIGDIKVLQRYERWRKPENLMILGFTDFLDRIFSNNWLPIVGMRRLGLWMLRRIPHVKIYALQLMTGLRGRPPELAQQ
ncbi:MAG: FAD-dependent hydroxylase [Cyanosarcina radialis HA8281-LM2]|jgi:2-octaprenyl-6-methoxyphenol hydroxylase|nr:FAD-dependent hydroxylase [Cyanosarcina radialis HA8281-LM2]